MSEAVFSANDLLLREHDSWPDIERATLHALYRALDHGGVIVFAGAGISMDYGFPGWEQLAKCVVKQVIEQEQEIGVKEIEDVYIRYAYELIQAREMTRDPRHLIGILNYCHRIYVRRIMKKLFGGVVQSAMKAA